jgi:dTDP-4-dehydrorhamnose reductase
MKVW